MIENNFNVGAIINDSELGDGNSINGDNVRGDCVIGGGGIEEREIAGLLQTVPPTAN